MDGIYIFLTVVGALLAAPYEDGEIKIIFNERQFAVIPAKAGMTMNYSQG